MWSSAAFEAPYPPQPGYASTEASDVMLTTVPSAAASCGRSAWISASGATVLVRKTASRSAAGYSAIGGGADAERPGVVDQQVQAAEAGDGTGELAAVARVGHVSGDGHDRGLGAQVGGGPGELVAAARRDDEGPAALGEPVRERETESAEAPVMRATGMRIIPISCDGSSVAFSAPHAAS